MKGETSKKNKIPNRMNNKLGIMIYYISVIIYEVRVSQLMNGNPADWFC